MTQTNEALLGPGNAEGASSSQPRWLATLSVIAPTAFLIAGAVSAIQAQTLASAYEGLFSWYVVAFAFYGCCGHLLPGLRERVAASIGWSSNGFQVELGAISLAVGVIGTLLLNGSWHLDALVALGAVWALFLGMAGLNHIVEVCRNQNYQFNNLCPIVWDLGVCASLLVVGFKARDGASG